jgi:NADPH:quinone reductase-like Zn-dependent oxidoreductase/acyl carrier protein
MEFAGIVTSTGSKTVGYSVGDLVVGFGSSSFSDRLVTKASAVAHIPPGISFSAAATIPSTFFTAYYALHHLAQLQEGEKVLIHGAAGGVGIAAIQIAKWCGAEIFATAGSDEKRDFLRLLGVDHILDSRSLAYADDIMEITEGKGIDVVLNSLAGEAINRNFRILKPFGRFLELGKRDFYENTKIGLRPFRNNITYFGIDADQLMSERPALTKKLFGEMMTLFNDRVLHPLPYHAFEAEDIVDAFRYMQQAKQIGKIIITYRNGISASYKRKTEARRDLALPADASYLVTGGLGGFGLKTAEWLAAKGAKNLVLLSRRGPTTDEAKEGIARLEAQGVKVLAKSCDITKREALIAVLKEAAASLPPLKGVVHAAVVIEDGLVRNLEADQIAKVFQPKILGAQYLHELTQNEKLDFFVMYSSATTLFGNPGQSAYVAANMWLEGLARQRRAMGLPATCALWGAIDDAGFLARNEKIKDALQGRMGGAALNSAVALDALENLLLENRSGEGVLELDWKALNRFLPSANAPKFAKLARQSGGDDESDTDGVDIQRMLAELPDAELISTFIEMLKQQVGEILRVPTDKIDPTRSIYDMGLDSLMGVELVVAMESVFGTRLPVMALSESPTIAKLAERLIAQLRGNDGKESEDAVAKHIQQVAGQHSTEFNAEQLASLSEQINSSEAKRMIN